MSVLEMNVIVILLYGICFFKEYKKGFLCALISLLSLGIALFCAYVFSPVMAKYIMLIPSDMMDSGVAFIDHTLQIMINRVLWFVGVFIIIRVVLKIFEGLMKTLQQLPLIKQTSAILGGCLGIVEATVYAMIISMICCLPINNKGVELVQNSLLKPIQEITSCLLSDYVQPFIELEELDSFDSNTFTSEQTELFEKWLVENGYESIEE